MPYSYHESTKLSREDAVALKSLSSTGELPNDHYWNALRTKHDANPTRFDKGNYVLAALLDRDQLQRQGKLGANAPLFSNTGFFSYAGAKHSLNMARFDHWHPFLGRLFELVLPTTSPAGETLTGSSNPTTPVVSTPGPFLPPGGTGTGGGGNNPTTPAASVPEPASALLIAVALTLALVVKFCTRKTSGRKTLGVPSPVMS